VYGVTQLDDIIYAVCPFNLPEERMVVWRFSATTCEQLTDTTVAGLGWSRDMAACERRSRLYVADYADCVWCVSAASQVKFIVSRRLKPWTLSVTSGRLLVTSRDTKALGWFDADGRELRPICLPDYMEPLHAVESPTGTFIVSHFNRDLKQYQVSELDREDRVLRHFAGSRLVPLGEPIHLAVDSRGMVFVADFDNCRVLLLDARLQLHRVVIDERQLNNKLPWRLCYKERSGHLLVGFAGIGRCIAVFDVLRR